MISENLIKNKGFDDVVILVNNGKVNVVLKNAMLSQEQISQIQNIIEKQFNVKIQDINISFKQQFLLPKTFINIFNLFKLNNCIFSNFSRIFFSIRLIINNMKI